jgi:hypothetical protein
LMMRTMASSRMCGASSSTHPVYAYTGRGRGTPRVCRELELNPNHPRVVNVKVRFVLRGTRCRGPRRDARVGRNAIVIGEVTSLSIAWREKHASGPPSTSLMPWTTSRRLAPAQMACATRAKQHSTEPPSPPLLVVRCAGDRRRVPCLCRLAQIGFTNRLRATSAC